MHNQINIECLYQLVEACLYANLRVFMPILHVYFLGARFGCWAYARGLDYSGRTSRSSSGLSHHLVDGLHHQPISWSVRHSPCSVFTLSPTSWFDCSVLADPSFQLFIAWTSPSANWLEHSALTPARCSLYHWPVGWTARCSLTSHSSYSSLGFHRQLCWVLASCAWDFSTYGFFMQLSPAELGTNDTMVLHHLGVSSGVSKRISEPMVLRASRAPILYNTNSVSKRTETRFHMTHSPRSSIGCVKDDFWVDGTFNTNCAPILHQD
jgi:hypothetical protein